VGRRQDLSVPRRRQHARARHVFPTDRRVQVRDVLVAAGTTAGSEVDATADLTELAVEVPGLLRYMDVTDPGMHTTDTIDFEVVLEGTVVLELDGGAEVTLRPGDTVVQNGTRHRWRNPGDTTARLAVFMCGASHADVPAADA
jgi:mannose-6-phosphate isomerase-like protein (cupin superfamily)